MSRGWLPAGPRPPGCAHWKMLHGRKILCFPFEGKGLLSKHLPVSLASPGYREEQRCLMGTRGLGSDFRLGWNHLVEHLCDHST